MGRKADTIFAGFLEALGKRTSSKPPTVNRMVRDLFGVHHRKPDMRAAAEQLGVSPATVRRWVRTNRLPARGPNKGRLEQSHEQWRASPAGRSSRVSKSQLGKLRGAETVTFTVRAKIQISAQDHSRHTMRTTTFLMDGEAAAEAYEAAMLGQDEEASELFAIGAEPAFGGSVEFTELQNVRMDW